MLRKSGAAIALVALAWHAQAAQAPALLCFGSEPSWTLDLTRPDRAKFEAPGARATVYRGGETRLAALSERAWRGKPVSGGGGDLVALLSDVACSDGASDARHPVTARVSLPDGRLLAGCCRGPAVASAPPQDPSLEGTTWRLETIAGADPALPASATPPVTLRFDAGRVEGFAGCSRISGPYAIDRDRLTVGALSRTTSACAEPAMRVEQAVTQALAGTLRHTVTGRRLTLLAESGAASTWQSEAAPVLAATNWEVTAFDNGKGAVVAPIARTTLSMTFRGGTVSGRAGCNTYSAGYSIDGDRIAIGRVASTRKACVGAGIMEQERRFLAALAAATNWSVRNGTLEMRRADGERALTAKVRDGTQ